MTCLKKYVNKRLNALSLDYFSSSGNPHTFFFCQMAKLKREKQCLLKENREGTAALESSVAALQLQMTEALTIAMNQNMELKVKLKEAESQIRRLQSANSG